eukprot:GHVS01020150.1.p1 GENE.GHVS01020150.1~~GHVS01020150.1.p1  ORF type:complete len:710 (+),score=120.24 GHVS01020150.1:35-2164(+)
MAGHHPGGTRVPSPPPARPSTPPSVNFGYYAAASPTHSNAASSYVMCSPLSYHHFSRQHRTGDLVQGSPSSLPICGASYTGQILRQNPPSPRPSTVLQSLTIPPSSDFCAATSAVFPGLIPSPPKEHNPGFTPSLPSSGDPPPCLTPISTPTPLHRQTAHSPSAHSIPLLPRPLDGGAPPCRRCSFSPRPPPLPSAYGGDSTFQGKSPRLPIPARPTNEATAAGGTKACGASNSDQMPNCAQLAGRVVSSPTKVFRLQRLLQTAIYGGVYVATVEAEFGGREGWGGGGGAALMPSARQGRQKRRVAVKVMSLELNKQSKETLQEDAFGELKYHSRMKGHRNVLVYEEVFQDNQLLYVVLPYAEYEDLFEILKKRPRPFDAGECRWLFWQLLHGADFLHSRGIAFRDHSLENVLMFHQKDDGTVYPKITDPGQAAFLEYNADGSVRKLVYDKTFGKSFRPPEVYNSSTYDPITIDVFCLGWMLFYCLTKNQLFDKAQDVDKNWQLLKTGRYAELLRARGGLHLTSYVRDLLFKMMCPNPAYRYTVRQAIAHPWFRNGPHVQVDDRTVYGLTHTAERLGPHPKQLQKLRQEQQARVEGRIKAAASRGGGELDGGESAEPIVSDGNSTTASVTTTTATRSSPPPGRSSRVNSPRLIKLPVSSPRSHQGGITRCSSGRSVNSPTASTAASLRTSIPSDEVMSPGGEADVMAVD